MDLDTINTISYAVTAGATLLLFVGAVAAWHTARETLLQMKEDSKAQTRPYVHARLEPSIGGKAWDLVLSNTGRTVAQDVQFTITPPPDRVDDVTRDMAIFSHTKQPMAPNTRVRMYWYLGAVPENDKTANRGFEGPHTLTVSYRDREGTEYKDSFNLNASAFKMTPEGSGGSEKEGDSRDVKKLSEIVKALNELRR